MDVFRAVILDLYDFARAAIARRIHLPSRKSTLALPTPLTISPTEKTTTLFSVPIEEKNVQSTLVVERLFVSVVNAPVLQHPTVTFDGVVTTLPYGTRVLVEHYSGRYAAVTVAGVSGWVLKEHLQRDECTVFPSFVVDQVYDSTHPDTVRLRAYINDMFVAGQVSLSLTSPEYVTYVLGRYGRVITWPVQRPRVAGSWQAHLKGVRGVHIGVAPKAASVMEYLTDHGGQLAYVTSVAPNETISISFISEDTAQYQEATYSKDEWRELRPVFISVL